MRFKLGHPDYPAFDIYTLSATPELEAQVERMAPHQIVSSAYDWPRRQYPFHGWTDSINSLWWPRGADHFATLILLINDRQAELIKASVASQVAATNGDGDLTGILADLASATDALEAMKPGDKLADHDAATPLEQALVAWSAIALEGQSGDFKPPYRSRMLTAFATTTTNVTAAAATSTSDTAPRPHLILQAMLAPKESPLDAELYEPAGMTADDVSETAETELMAWKLYPLPPVRLPDAPAPMDTSGLWLLPLVDIRYFYRTVPLNPRTGGSETAAATSGDFDWPVVYADPDDDTPDWMPPTRDYPDDSAGPANPVDIADAGTHPDIVGNMSWGKAADIQAAMCNCRVVCRDVRSNFNAPAGDTQHADFTGVLADQPDDPTQAHKAARASVVTRGFGYRVGQTLTLVGGTGTAATFEVVTVGANGAVTAVKVLTAGSYTAVPTNPAATTGGSGCTLKVDYYIGSYHGDAIRLAGYPGNLIAGGLSDSDVVQDLIARKLQFLFRVADDEFLYSVVVYPTQEDPTSTAHFAEDATGLGTTERTHVPKVFLGVPATSRSPEGAHRAALVTAAKQWALLYYRWRRKQAFFKYQAIAPVIPNGHVSVIRWDFAQNQYETTYVAIEGVEGTEDAGCCFERDGFWACLEGEGSISDGLDGYYAYEELEDSGGTLTPKSNGRVGYVKNVNGQAANFNPARSDNDKRACPIGSQVWMRLGTPYLDTTTGEVFDHLRFNMDDLLQVIKLDRDGQRNEYGHYPARVMRYDPDSRTFVESELIWAILLQ